MQIPGSQLTRRAMKSLLEGLIVTTVVTMAALTRYKPEGGYHALQLAAFSDRLETVKLSPSDRTNLEFGLKLDFLFLVLYPCTLSLACRFAVRSSPRSSSLCRIGRLLSIAVLSAIPSDVFDNFSVLHYLSSGSSRGLLILGGLCTIWDFTIAGIAVVFSVGVTIARMFRRRPTARTQAVEFLKVFEKEREAILKTRSAEDSREFGAGEFVGLAFSGGGIRSATFNLGILQALADFNLLHRVDYLSTVSGGGYIGAWLLARMKRNEQNIRDVEKELSPEQCPDPNSRAWAPIQFLRAYSNYLTPKLGFLSADTWSIAAIWLRNTILIQSVLMLALGALLLVPRWSPLILSNLPAVWVRVPAFALLAVAVTASAMGLRNFGTSNTMTQYDVLKSVVMPLFLLSWYSAAVIWSGSQPWTPTSFAVGVGLSVMVALLIVQGSGNVGKQPRAVLSAWELLFFTLFSSAVAAILAYALTNLSDVLSDLWRVITFGPIVVIAALSFVITAHIGVLGRALPDGQREWVSRVGAWLNIYGLCWIALFFTAIYAPFVVLWLHQRFLLVLPTLTIGWVVSTIAGLASAWSAKTGHGTTGKQSAWLTLIATYAPYIFVAGLLFALSFLIHIVIVGIFQYPATEQSFQSWWGILSSDGFKAMQRYYSDVLTYGACQALPFLAASVGLGVTAFLLSRRFDLNEFSMHHLYKNRLIRCYLGAARNDRMKTRDAFTGFDPKDDIPLHDLPRRPYAILNATLNLVHGKTLAWQERKATSFVFTPEYCGFYRSDDALAPVFPDGRLASFAYRPTRAYGGGLQLGTAMAISGAAVNPNMGSFSTSAAAFLLTAFNVRLGWWIGNPRHNGRWNQSSPKTGIFYLLAELTGSTNDERGFVNLSDGGHFENLGIYELVRRRCKYIIACDGSQDSEFAFEDLGNAIRKCDADFCAEIEIDLSQIRPDASTRQSRAHCAVGKITYPQTQTEPESSGYLVYLKTSLTGDEPSDALEYAKLHAEFPHQSTADQWFNESQFESYRRLGYHIGHKVFERSIRILTVNDPQTLPDKKKCTMEVFFHDLYDIWYPPSPAVGKMFAKHGEAFDRLLERLGNSDNLSDLAKEFYAAIQSGDSQAKFLYCNSIIQLMENVYIDLNLEENASHPDNEGWKNIFLLWWSSPTFQHAWEISRSTFGSRFQRWCERELDKRR